MTMLTTLPRPSVAIDEPPAPAADLLPGWHPDPLGCHRLRFHDGRTWTDHVTRFGPVPCSGCAPVAAAT